MKPSKSVSEWLSLFAESDRSTYGEFSCDLAEDYWNERMTPQEMVLLLRSDCIQAQQSASWAISDWARLNIASRELLDISLQTTNRKIKGHALSFIARCVTLPMGEKRAILEKHVTDSDSEISQWANDILASLED